MARFYERLADHAVNIARRVIYLAGVASFQRLRQKLDTTVSRDIVELKSDKNCRIHADVRSRLRESNHG